MVFPSVQEYVVAADLEGVVESALQCLRVDNLPIKVNIGKPEKVLLMIIRASGAILDPCIVPLEHPFIEKISKFFLKKLKVDYQSRVLKLNLTSSELKLKSLFTPPKIYKFPSLSISNPALTFLSSLLLRFKCFLFNHLLATKSKVRNLE